MERVYLDLKARIRSGAYAPGTRLDPAQLAKSLGYNPDPFMMAVALGAACDFLSPIGHQNNLLVKEPGGYTFADYSRLGLPLSLLVLFVGTPLIAWAWPLS